MLRRIRMAKNLSTTLTLATAALLAAGCGASGGGGGGGGYYIDPDAGTSFGNDTVSTADTGSGTGKDTAAPPDTSTVKDSTAGSDVQLQDTTLQDTTLQDTAPKDTTPQDTAGGTDSKPTDTKTDTAVKDVPVVNTCGTGSDIASLLKCTEGPVDFTLTGALVTYVEPSGFFVYDTSSSRGMLIYVGTTWPYPKPKVDDEITLHITKYASYQGQQEVTASDSLVVTGAGTASTTALNLATLDAASFAEDYESRLLVGKGLKVKVLNGPDGVATLPMAGDVTLRVDGTTNLCTGATFELKSGVLTQFGGAYRVQIMNGAADLGTVDTTGCGAAPGYDSSNWGFEEASSADPPPDFYKVGTGMSVVRDTANAHAGSAGAKVVLTSQDNQDLFSGMQVPIVAGQKATISVWIKDNDPAGRARLGLVFYKADGSTVAASQYSGSYSVDGAAWVQLTYAFTAPADVASVRGMLRMYDVVPTGGTWAGTATVYIDDWSVTAQ